MMHYNDSYHGLVVRLELVVGPTLLRQLLTIGL